jgi:CHAT domain-containing protein
MTCGRWARELIAASTLLVLAFVGAANAMGTSDGDFSCPITSGEAVTLEREQISELFIARGIDTPLTEIVAANLQASVEHYLLPRPDVADDRARALLFYIGNAEVLCAMFWRIDDDGNNVFIVDRLSVAPAEIVPMIDEMVMGMQGAQTNGLRGAVRRSEQEEPATRGATTLVTVERPSTEDMLAQLSLLLFPAAIADHLDDLASLTIVPCLNIGIVPFAALDPTGDGIPFVETTVINVEAELGHIYDYRMFEWDSDIGSVAVFGDPDATVDAEWSFPRLPGAQREAVAIAAHFGVAPILGDGATPRRLVDAIAEAGYIHIAAHGLSSVEDPLDGSFLALTGGRLTAREIQHLSLVNYPLVVLSACQTGLGGPLDAGIIGLARGFVIAGAAATVATLWNVDDAATEGIMVEFAENLGSMNPAEALRRAQLSARERYAHPRYWSGFMVFGSRVLTIRPG